MTLLQVEELASYWAEHPPLHLLVGAYLGIGKDTQKRQATPAGRAAKAAGEPGSVLAGLGPGFGVGDVHAGLTPVELDFAELRRRAVAAA
jgi:hypothetical protein